MTFSRMASSAKVKIFGIALALIVSSGIYVAVLLVPPPAPEPIHSGRYTLSDVTIINPGSQRQSSADLAISNERFLDDGAVGQNESNEFAGMFVLPGFVDAHTHWPSASVLELTRHFSLLHLAHGVTTTRDAGDIDGTAIPAARGLIGSGFPMPDLLSCGPFVAAPGHEVWANSMLYSHENEADAIAAAIKEDDHDCIKSYEGLSAAQIAALAKAAEREGLKLIGHVPLPLRIEDSGLPGAEHLFGIAPTQSLADKSVLSRNGDWDGVTTQRIEEAAGQILVQAVEITPTLSTLSSLQGYLEYDAAVLESAVTMPSFYGEVVWDPKTGLPVYRGLTPEQLERAGRALAKKKTLVRILSERGAVLRIGTDVGQPFTSPGSSYWQELRAFADAGIAPEKVLTYATSVGANTIGETSGVIAPQRPANFLIFRQDPTLSLNHLDSLVAVAVDGKLYRKSDLDKAIEQSLARYESPLLRWISHIVAQRKIDEAASNF